MSPLMTIRDAVITGGNFTLKEEFCPLVSPDQHAVHARFLAQEQQEKGYCDNGALADEVARLLAWCQSDDDRRANHPTMIVHGPENVGKSTLLRTAAFHLACENKPFAFICFSKPKLPDAREPRLDQVPATLLSQLQCHYPSIRHSVQGVLRNDPGAFGNVLDVQLEEILIPTLKTAIKASGADLFIIMDDLDHISSESYRLEILGFLKRLTTLKGVFAILHLREGPSPQDVVDCSTSLAVLWRISEKLKLERIQSTTTPSHHTGEDASRRLHSTSVPLTCSFPRTIPEPCKLVETWKSEEDGPPNTVTHSLVPATLYQSPDDHRLQFPCFMKPIDQDTLPLPLDLPSTIRSYMFNPLLPNRPSLAKPINLWHPFPQLKRGLTGQALARSVLPGDIICISSDGRADTKFNIFYSESENRFYGNRPPPAYVAFGPPLVSYQDCEEHNVGRLYHAVKGDNHRRTDKAWSDAIQHAAPDKQKTIRLGFDIEAKERKKDAFCAVTYLPRGSGRLALDISSTESDFPSRLSQYITEQGAHWYAHYQLHDENLVDGGLILVTAAHLAQVWASAFLHIPAGSTGSTTVQLYQEENTDVYSWESTSSHLEGNLGPALCDLSKPDRRALEWNQCIAIEGFSLSRLSEPEQVRRAGPSSWRDLLATRRGSWRRQRQPTQSAPQILSAQTSPSSSSPGSSSQASFLQTLFPKWKKVRRVD